MYVFHKEQLPSVFSTYFGENALRHHDTRQKDQFHTYRHTVFSKYGKRNIKYKGSKLWIISQLI